MPSPQPSKTTKTLSSKTDKRSRTLKNKTPSVKTKPGSKGVAVSDTATVQSTKKVKRLKSSGKSPRRIVTEKPVPEDGEEDVGEDSSEQVSLHIIQRRQTQMVNVSNPPSE